jgi:hypothetical protein
MILYWGLVAETHAHITMSRSGSAGNTGAQLSASAIRCVLPGTHKTSKVYIARFSQRCCSLALPRDDSGFPNRPTSGWWSVTTSNFGMPLK